MVLRNTCDRWWTRDMYSHKDLMWRGLGECTVGDFSVNRTSKISQNNIRDVKHCKNMLKYVYTNIKLNISVYYNQNLWNPTENTEIRFQKSGTSANAINYCHEHIHYSVNRPAVTICSRVIQRREFADRFCLKICCRTGFQPPIFQSLNLTGRCWTDWMCNDRRGFVDKCCWIRMTMETGAWPVWKGKYWSLKVIWYSASNPYTWYIP